MYCIKNFNIHFIIIANLVIKFDHQRTHFSNVIHVKERYGNLSFGLIFHLECNLSKNTIQKSSQSKDE